MKLKWLLIGIAAIILSGFLPSRSLACSTCNCGDPTLTLLGNEKPYPGRFRLSTDYKFKSEEVGVPLVNQVSLIESRISLVAAYSPTSWLFLSLSFPALVIKELEHVSGRKDKTKNIGDIDLTTKFFLSPRGGEHLYGVLSSIRFPSAPEVSDNTGKPINFDAQPGTGAWGGGAGLWYSFYRFPWSLYASSMAHIFSKGNQEMQPGRALLSTLTGQFHTNYNLAFRLGLDSSLSQKDEMLGVPDPNSGGYLVSVAPAIIWSPIQDWVFHATLQIPAIKGLNGDHSQGLTFITGVIHDFAF